MALSRLGNFIEMVDIRNKNGFYKEKDVRGISTTKIFIKTKANLNNVNLLGYKIVQKNCFAYVADTSRRGEKIAIAYSENYSYIISSIYTTFKVKDESKLLPRYLMMFFNRPEFDRYARFNSWGSARETFSWDDFCNIELNIPSIEIQKKYVAIYEAMLDNQKAYKKGLDDLKLVCDGYIEALRKTKKVSLEGLLIESDERNTSLLAKSEKGVSIQKIFIDTKAKAKDISKQKLVREHYFAYNSNTSRNSDTISIALNQDNPCVVSATYTVFSCRPNILPEYLYLWFKRKEFDRFARFNSWGSARETISLKEIEKAEIALPSLETQQAIVKMLSAYQNRIEFAKTLKEKIANLCPVLIRGSIAESQGGK